VTDNPPDPVIRGILADARRIAIVGLSDRADRPSHDVAAYLQRAGYRIVPVNPNLAGRELLGEQVVASLGEIAGGVDIVDVFRRSDLAGDAITGALAIRAPVIWLQLGVRNETAAAKARAEGRVVIQDRCIKIEHARLRP
jgi:predicted CoA-binding protein